MTAETQFPPASGGAPDLQRLRIHRAPEDLPRRRFPLGVVLAILVLAGGAVAAWTLHFGVPVVATARATVEVPRGGAGGYVLTATGYVVSRRTANVGSKLAGRIQAILVEEGSRVESGQVLARLEATEYEARVAEAAAQVADAAREVERVRRLVEGGASGAQALDAASTRLDVEKARLALAQTDLDATAIRAPFAGTVIAKPAEVGETISFGVVSGSVSTGVIATIADLDALEVDTDVGEAHVAKVEDGLPADIVLDAFPDVRFRGVVRKVMPRAVRRTTTVPTRVRFLEPDPRVRPDMSAKVFFGADGGSTAPGQPRVFVPAAALVERDGAAAVRVVREGRVFAVAVRVGAREGGRVEIAEGLSGNEVVVIGGGRELADGSRVRVAAGP